MEQNYGELASSRLQWIVYTAKMTLASMVGKYEIQAKIALARMVGKYQTQVKKYRPGTGGTWERKRYGGGTGWLGVVRARWGKTVRGPYGLRCGSWTGHGVGAVRGPHLSPSAARTGNVQGPFGCPYRLLLGLPLPCPYGHVYWDSSY